MTGGVGVPTVSLKLADGTVMDEEETCTTPKPYSEMVRSGLTNEQYLALLSLPVAAETHPALRPCPVAQVLQHAAAPWWLVEGATQIAVERGIPEMVIGLTIVAIGTSLPELATTVIAALRGQRNLAVGNAVGSSIFSIGAVPGVSSLLAPEGIPVAESASGFEIRRWEGALFLGLYIAYTGYLLLNATDHERLPANSVVMLWFVLPTVASSLGALAGFDAGLRKGREQTRNYDRGLAPPGGVGRSADA